MAVSHNDIPREGGGLASGMWHVQLNSPLNANMGMVHFQEGKTQKPIDGRKLRRLVSAMGNSILWCERVEDGYRCGEPCEAPKAPKAMPAAPKAFKAPQKTTRRSNKGKRK